MSAEPATTALPAERVVSIDIFRGLTMTVMIFVNELSGVKGLPRWTYHARGDEDWMTYVDMVFPFFLFLVGMSMPLGIEQRIRRGNSRLALWGHVAQRTAGLLVLGLMLANAEMASAPRMGLDGNLWLLLGLVAAALFLNTWPKQGRLGRLAPWLRAAGLAGAAILLAIFRRRTPAGGVGWLDFSYPEILGLIGITYFATAVLYIPTRRWRWAPLAWVALLTGFNVLCTGRWIAFPAWWNEYIFPFSNGARCAVTMAGVATAGLFLGRDRLAPNRAIGAAMGLGAAALALGVALMPLGISKDRETPAWALWCWGAAAICYALLYWVCDRRRWTGWAGFARTAGGNTLTTYLLPDLWDTALGLAGITFFATHWNRGWPGVAQTVVYTAVILGLSRLATRLGVRLRF